MISTQFVFARVEFVISITASGVRSRSLYPYWFLLVIMCSILSSIFVGRGLWPYFVNDLREEAGSVICASMRIIIFLCILLHPLARWSEVSVLVLPHSLLVV